MTSSFSVSRLFLPPPTGRTATRDWIGGELTAWDQISFANTCVIGGITYTDLPVVDPSGIDTGPVLIARLPSGMIIMGPLNRRGGVQPDLLLMRVLNSDVSTGSTAFTAAGDLSFPLQTGTRYAVDGMLIMRTDEELDSKLGWSVPSDTLIRWGMYGKQRDTVVFSAQDDLIDVGVIDSDVTPNGAQQVVGFNGLSMCQPRAFVDVGDTPGALTLQFAKWATDPGNATLRAGSWLRLAQIGDGDGSGQTITKNYQATGSRSYDVGGSAIGGTDGANFVYHGSFPDRSFGNERSVILFDGAAIRADLSNATVRTARLWLRCTKAEESRGSFAGTAAGTAIPSAYDPGYGSVQSSDDAWSVNAWNFVDITYGGLLSRILSGTNVIGLPPTLFGLAATGFNGYGGTAGLRPYIEITYTAPV